MSARAKRVIMWSAVALIVSMAICFAVGAGCYFVGRKAQGRMYRREAMAVVGLSWVLATLLGALPFYFCGVYRSASVRLMGDTQQPVVYDFDGVAWNRWELLKEPLAAEQYWLVGVLVDRGARGYRREALHSRTPPQNRWPAERASERPPYRVQTPTLG